MTLLQIIK